MSAPPRIKRQGGRDVILCKVKKMKYFLGIDGGGSKTECVLMDEAGTVVARATGAGTNLGRTSAEKLREILTGLLGAMQQDFVRQGVVRKDSVRQSSMRQDSMRQGDVRQSSMRQDSKRKGTGDSDVVCEAVGAGFAGAGDEKNRKMAEEVLAGLLPDSKLFVVGDMEVALEAAFGGGPGVVLIAGTGSIACGRNAAGKTARAGGKGPAVSDEGSGYAIGKAAVETVLMSEGNPQKATVLSEGVLAALGMDAADSADSIDSTDSIDSAVSLQGWVVPERAAEVAALVEVVASAAEAGDATARGILEQAGRELVRLAVTVAQELFPTGEAITVALGGGVFRAAPALFEGVREGLQTARPQARVARFLRTPAEGGARLARRWWQENSSERGELSG